MLLRGLNSPKYVFFETKKLVIKICVYISAKQITCFKEVCTSEPEPGPRGKSIALVFACRVGRSHIYLFVHACSCSMNLM